MKHIWVVEVSGADKWRPAGMELGSEAFLKREGARDRMWELQEQSPGLKWRIAKYVREAK